MSSEVEPLEQITSITFTSVDSSSAQDLYCNLLWRDIRWRNLFLRVFFKIFFWCGPFKKSLLNLFQYCSCYLFIFKCLVFFGYKPCRISALQPKIEPVPAASEGESLSTGLAGKSIFEVLKMKNCINNSTDNTSQFQYGCQVALKMIWKDNTWLMAPMGGKRQRGGILSSTVAQCVCSTEWIFYDGSH